ncbi:MAG: DUF411 domain-containing protein, partial [Rhodothermales bacterium]|nr:DUF411 domain-containing protein [Rhodothermales bacterium]
MTRKLVIIGIAFAVGIIGAGVLQSSSPAKEITVYKTPTCGFCGKWVDHLKSAGYDVKTQDLNSLAEIKDTHGIPAGLRTCHTGIIDGYVVEGHVPARFVTQLLEEKPDIAGIGV